MAWGIRVSDGNGWTVIFGQDAWWGGRYDSRADAERGSADLKQTYEHVEVVEL
jgi:hypothetical protein